MKLHTLLLGIGLLCCAALHGQSLATVTLAGEGRQLQAMVPSVSNFCALLDMPANEAAAALRDCGYAELQVQDGYRRFSNTTEERPSYTQGLHMVLFQADEVKYVTALDLHVLGEAVGALKQELRSGYLGEMPDNDGYRIEVYALQHKGEAYEVFITHRPKYFEVAFLRTSR